jgi:hypothetical protein
MNLGTGAKPFRSRPPDPQLPIGEHHKAAGEGIESFVLYNGANAAYERIGAGRTQPHQEKTSVSSGLELAHVGEIEILRYEEPIVSPRGVPDIAIRFALQSLGSDSIDVVTQRRQLIGKSIGGCSRPV